MLEQHTLAALQGAKALLAFSGGSDSTALFHLLLEQGCPFDIAHVNYRTRAQSDTEAQGAMELARIHHKTCHQMIAPPIERNFESEARRMRYQFFERLIREHGYDVLLTAHHLGDRLEWFLMQLCKGSGVYELLGMQTIEEREGYTLIRPLLHVSKAELLEYLRHQEIQWLEDASNTDEALARNRFRHRFATPLLAEYAQGIKRSFEYLEEDTAFEAPHLYHTKELTLFTTLSDARHNKIVIDRILKSRGHLMRKGDRQALKGRCNWVVGRRFAVSITAHYTYIAPYRRCVMEATFKEHCRTLGIPALLRGYLFEEPEAFSWVVSLLSKA